MSLTSIVLHPHLQPLSLFYTELAVPWPPRSYKAVSCFQLHCCRTIACPGSGTWIIQSQLTFCSPKAKPKAQHIRGYVQSIYAKLLCTKAWYLDINSCGCYTFLGLSVPECHIFAYVNAWFLIFGQIVFQAAPLSDMRSSQTSLASAFRTPVSKASGSPGLFDFDGLQGSAAPLSQMQRLREKMSRLQWAASTLISALWQAECLN